MTTRRTVKQTADTPKLMPRDDPDSEYYIPPDERAAMDAEDAEAEFEDGVRTKMAGKKEWLEVDRRMAAEKSTWERPVWINGAQIKPSNDRWLVENLWPHSGNVQMSGYMKAGKTSVKQTLISSLLTGEDFLGHTVLGHNLRVGSVDLELTDDEIMDYLSDPEIRNHENLFHLNLRDHPGWFDLMDDEHFHATAEDIMALDLDVLFIDPTTPLLMSKNQSPNDPEVVNPLLMRFVDLKVATGVKHLWFSMQTPHSARDRAAGTYLTGAWADVLWNVMMKNKDDLTGPRKFKAWGRGVGLLHDVTMDSETGMLTAGDYVATLSGTESRREDILDLIMDEPMRPVTIAAKLGVSKNTIQNDLDMLLETGDITREKVGGQAWEYLAN